MITATNKVTGEVVELPTDTDEQIVSAWNIAREYERFASVLKDQLKGLVPNLVDHKGISQPINGYMFRVSNIQRYNYDKSVLRQQLDEDTLDLFLVPDKTAIDKYLKENLEQLSEASTVIRNAMIPTGKPYQVIKLERLDRNE
jgi:hypothetical protein